MHTYRFLSVLGSTALVAASFLALTQASSEAQPTATRDLAVKAPTYYKKKYKKKKCRRSERTRKSLNSCMEQEKCFSLSYKKVEHPCNDASDTCSFKWKVCIDINRDDPCCRVKKSDYPFSRACIRGSKTHGCVDNDVTFDGIKAIKNLGFGDEYCELVSPGDDAVFLLVRVVVTFIYIFIWILYILIWMGIFLHPRASLCCPNLAATYTA